MTVRGNAASFASFDTSELSEELLEALLSASCSSGDADKASTTTAPVSTGLLERAGRAEDVASDLEDVV